MSMHGPLLFGKYKLLELVARGGMAEVFKAKSYGVDGFEKLVVIKRILPELAQNQSFVEMCIKEAKLAVALSHANIVQVFDLGREEDTYFIVMEFVHGMDFAEVLRRCRRAEVRPPWEISVYVASETARALDYAHRRRDAQMRPLKIVHRDVSPQNVLLSFEGEVKVTDFGIAKARTTIEEAGTIKGKYAYMAPEQARGLEVDARADVYALGVVLYEALTGRNPFQESTPFETLRRVQTGAFTPVREAEPGVPPELARIVETALARDVDARHASAAKFYEDLAGFLYSTGKRVAAHDLSEWLAGLRGRAERDDESKRVRDALEDAEPGQAKTPVEVPASARGGRSQPGAAPGSPRGPVERRDVTLLSIETGATPREALEPLYAMAKRYGGERVEQGESFAVWVFGAREPDGRDTELAVRCALKMQRAARPGAPRARLGFGVHAARVHVAGDGRPEHDQWFTAALAQVRDLGRAAGARVLASEPVGRLIGDQFTLASVRGPDAALDRVAGTPLEVQRERTSSEGRHRRFIGHADAFKKLGETLARTTRKGGHVVTVVGDAGTGKSRFLEEVQYRLRRMNHPAGFHTALCLSHERATPLAGLLSMLRAILGIDESDAEPIVREKAARLRELGLSAEELRAVGVLLGTAAADEAAAGATTLRAATLKIATRLAQDRLTVLCWDGAEALDPETLSVVDELVRNAGRAPLAIVLAARPTLDPPWRGGPRVVQIVLGPLGDEDVRQLVLLRLGLGRDDTLPEPLLDDLGIKGAGNPLFVEEYLRSLVEAGAVDVRDGEVTYRRQVAEVGVPKTLRGLVASELSRLQPDERAVLQVAAVIGLRFHRAPLAAVVELAPAALDAALDALLRRGALVRSSSDEFAFAHELRRDVVYEQIPLEPRRLLHGAVAAAIERLFGDRLDELAERLGHHYREAHDRGLASVYLARAARRQVAEQAYEAAAQNVARALELVLGSPRAEPARVVALYEQLGEAVVRGQLTVAWLDRLKLGLAYAEEARDDAATARLLVLVGRLLLQVSRTGEAVAHFERARVLLEGGGDEAALGAIVTAIGGAYVRNGEFGRAVPFLERAAALAEGRGDRPAAGLALLALARCEAAGGEGPRAMATWQRAHDALGEGAEPSARAEADKALAFVHFHARRFETAATHFASAMETGREFGLPFEWAVNAHNCGDAWTRLGDYKRAFAAFKVSNDVARAHGYERLVSLNQVFLGFLDAVQLDSADARARLAAGLEHAEAHGYAWDVMQTRYLMGLLAKQRGEHELARKHLRDACALANQSDDRMFAEDCELLLREVATIPPGSRA